MLQMPPELNYCLFTIQGLATHLSLIKYLMGDPNAFK